MLLKFVVFVFLVFLWYVVMMFGILLSLRVCGVMNGCGGCMRFMWFFVVIVFGVIGRLLFRNIGLEIWLMC